MDAVIVVFTISLFIFRERNKAAFFTFCLFIFYFFFGPAHDTLKKWTGNGFLSGYRFLLPLALLFFICLFVFIKRRQKPFTATNRYLNLLFLLLIGADLAGFLFKKVPVKPVVHQNRFQPCDSCTKPDIYFIIADGYPGRIQLKDNFQYDNSGFENELARRGFHIVDSSTSNYNFTTFSVASMLDMQYLSNIHGSNSDRHDMLICYNSIKRNTLFDFLNSRGYRLYNHSIFDLEKDPSRAKPTFLPRKTRPIVSQTFFYRIRKDLGHLLVTKLKIRSVTRNLRNLDLRNNNKIFELTKEVAGSETANPKFVYTHLVMPHYPYYFDSSGRQAPFEILTDEYATNQKAFIEYLAYSNKKLLELVDHIRANAPSPPLIILMGDHGFREFREPVAEKYHFMNLNAVLLPGSRYNGFYKGMSGVNQFRVILNTQFGQQLPLLKDSSSFLRE